MLITTRRVIDIFSGKTLEWEGYEYTGPVVLCKGADANQRVEANSSRDFYLGLSNDFRSQFANQTAILNGLNSAFAPIEQAGINQYGFSPAEDAAFRTQATEATGAEYNKALTAVNAGLNAQGGGNTYIPTGSANQTRLDVAKAAASQEASQNLGITQAGYEQGRQNFLNAASALSGVASLENPLGYAGAATTAGNAAFNQETTVYNENQAANPWGAVGGILGGVAGSFLGPIGSAIGSRIGSAIGGGGSSSTSGGGGGDTGSSGFIGTDI